MQGLIISCPNDAEQPVHYWLVDDGQLIDSGQALLNALPEISDDARCMLLLPPADTMLRWHDMPDMPAKQVETAASLKAAELSASKDDLHIAAKAQSDGRILTAQISKTWLQSRLDLLAENGVDPDIILPAAMALPPVEDTRVQGKIADWSVIIGKDFAAPDEPSLRDVLVGNAKVKNLSKAEIQPGLLASFAAPPINLRSGIFAKRNSIQWITARQGKMLVILIGLLLVVSLLLAIATLWRFSSATAQEDEKALTAAQKLVPDVNEVGQAETRVSQELRGRAGGGDFLQLSSALYTALQDAPSVQLKSMRFGQDQILTASLSAPSSDIINPVLLAVQQEGYRITVNSRQEANGATIADITMRVP